MDFNNNDYVYKIIPDILGNKKSKSPAIFHLKGISHDTFSDAVRAENIISKNHVREEASKLIADNSAKLVSDSVVKIENMTCSGKEITSYQELCEFGPREFVNWVVAAVYSYEFLSDNELKN